MSKLDELIEKLCPNGVEYKKIKDCCKIETGKLNANAAEQNGEYMFFTTAKEPSKTNTYKWDTEALLIAGNANVGDVKHYKGKFNAYQRTYVLTDFTERINIRFLYYSLLNNLKTYLDGHKNEAAMTYIVISTLENFSVPVPPLEVQNEIVRILNDFTELSAELSAELKARQKQYEYYSNKLLDLKEYEYDSLENLCEIVDYRGKTPQKVSNGIFLVTAKNIRKGFIDYEKSQEYISEYNYDEIMHRGLPKIGDVLITTEAPCGNVAQVDNENIALAQRVIKYRPKDSKINSTFLKYILLSDEFQNKLLKNATGGTVKGIKGSKLHKLTIPVPPIDIQLKITKILDNFDKLNNNIILGIPAEIEARQKQYEYYRDKLLNFKELK